MEGMEGVEQRLDELIIVNYIFLAIFIAALVITVWRNRRD